MKKGYIISGIAVVISAVITIVLYAKNKAKEGFDEIREATTLPEEELPSDKNNSEENSKQI